MTGLLSAISGYFTKFILLGTVLPVVVFIISFVILVRPLLPGDLPILLPLAALEPQWQLLVATLFTVLISGLLYSLNIPIIQLYEGYPWSETRIGKRRTKQYQKIFEACERRIRGTRTLLRAMLTFENDPARITSIGAVLQNINLDRQTLNWREAYDAIQAKWDRQQQDLIADFPTNQSLILPTKLGNAIRAFEYYPDREYGIDGVTGWSRLIAKIDPAYAAAIDDAKTSFDFMINLSLLGAISVAMQLAAGLFSRMPFASPGRLFTWLIFLLITALLGFAFYHLSISRASAWGETVKGAFDLYRKDLLAQLGYELKLKTRSEEREVWDSISLQMIYGDQPDGPRTPTYIEKSAPPFFSEMKESDIPLRISRGVESLWSKRKATVVVLIKNLDQKRTAEDLQITDTLDKNLHYEWNSASIDGQRIFVEGSNPYLFKIGSLAAGKEVELRYNVIRLG
jgi:hypothetical protein